MNEVLFWGRGTGNTEIKGSLFNVWCLRWILDIKVEMPGRRRLYRFPFVARDINLSFISLEMALEDMGLDMTTNTRLDTWTSPDGRHQNQIDHILCSRRWRSSIQSAKTRPGAGCGSDHEHLIAKFRMKLKKVEKTTRPFRYDLNQIPYDYTVEVRNRFKGLDLIDRVLMN